MKAKEIRSLSDVDLGKEMENSYRELFNLRFRLATKQLTNYKEIGNVKKKIARLKTVARERDLQRV